MAEKNVTIVATRNVRVAGESLGIGKSMSVPESVARDVVFAGKAVIKAAKPAAKKTAASKRAAKREK